MYPVTISKPESLKELWRTLPGVPRPRKFLAGGTDLAARAHDGTGLPCSWIDISGLPELSLIKETKTAVFIGAGVKISELEDSPVIKKWLPVLHSASSSFASPPLRNMATLGGNCSNASPAADGACALCCERAEAVIESNGKIRRVPLEEFFIAPGKTALRPDELIKGFEVKKAEHSGVYMKLSSRKSFSIAKVSVAVALWMEGSRIGGVSVTMGAVGPVILRALKTEKYLRGKELSEVLAGEAAKIIMGESRPVTDHRSNAVYRKEMTGVLLKRALNSMLPPSPLSPPVEGGGYI